MFTILFPFSIIRLSPVIAATCMLKLTMASLSLGELWLWASPLIEYVGVAYEFGIALHGWEDVGQGW